MHKLKRPVLIENHQLILHEMQVNDADYWFRFMKLDDIQKYLPDRFETLDRMENTLSWLIGQYDLEISDIIRITLAIHLKRDESHPIGFVSYGPLPEDENLREIAYAVHPENRNIGIATEASKMFINWVRDMLTDVPLYAGVHASNVASIRVLSKLGFTQLHSGDENRPKTDSGTLVFRME